MINCRPMLILRLGGTEVHSGWVWKSGLSRTTAREAGPSLAGGCVSFTRMHGKPLRRRWWNSWIEWADKDCSTNKRL